MKQAGSTPWRRVAKLAELSAHPCAASVDGIELVLVQSADGVRAYDAVCPHRGALLSEGEIADGKLICRGHGWRFDLVTGERVGGIPKACLRSHPTRVEGDDVLLQIGTTPAAGALVTSALRKLDDLPGPRGWPFFGNAFQIDVPRIHHILEGWVQKYGPLVKVSLMGKPVLIVGDAKLSEALLLARPKSVRRPTALELVFDEMGVTGVFSTEGDAWREQRRLALQALANRHLRGFFPTLRRVVERLDARLCREASEGKVVEIQDDLMRFTVDVTTSLVFSTDMNTLDGGDDVLQRHLSHVFPAFARRTFAVFPYWRYFRLPVDRALDRALGEIRKLQDRLVNETRARLAARPANDTEPRDFLEAMLLARDEHGRPFSNEIIYGNMLTMLLAGEDTTAQSLAWVVHFLCERPDVVARLRDEADAAFGSQRVPFDFDRAQDLPYFDAVINEAMRLRPVAPFLGLEAVEDLVVGDVQVRKGTWIDVMLRLPALDAAHFADPESFRPERWLPERPKTEAHVSGASLPFGSGPRICPGRSLALLEMRVVLATLIKNFDVERVGSPDDIVEHFSFTTSPRGLRIRLHERAAAAGSLETAAARSVSA